MAPSTATEYIWVSVREARTRKINGLGALGFGTQNPSLSETPAYGASGSELVSKDARDLGGRYVGLIGLRIDRK